MIHGVRGRDLPHQGRQFSRPCVFVSRSTQADALLPCNGRSCIRQLRSVDFTDARKGGMSWIVKGCRLNVVVAP